MSNIRKQHLLFLLSHYLGYGTLDDILRRIRRKPITIILAFHDVLPEFVQSFELKMQFLKIKTNVISLHDFFSGKADVKRINTVITFDDGYKSLITVVFPILSKLKLPATFFLSSGFTGLSPEKESAFAKIKFNKVNMSGCLSYEDVKELAIEGITIGGHTINHVNLAEMSDINQLRSEIIQDKTRLEDIIKRNIDYFAYPFGIFHNPRIDIINIIKECGYKGAVTLLPGGNNAATPPFLLRRMITSAWLPNNVFRAIVYNNYPPVNLIRKLFVKASHQ